MENTLKIDMISSNDAIGIKVDMPIQVPESQIRRGLRLMNGTHVMLP